MKRYIGSDIYRISPSEVDLSLYDPFLARSFQQIQEVSKRAGISEIENWKPIRFRGIFQTLEPTINRNGRMYLKEPYLKVLKESVYPRIKAKVFYGELDHHEGEIRFEHASHLVTKMWVEGNKVFGEAITIPTPAGVIASNLLKSGLQVGVSVDAWAEVESRQIESKQVEVVHIEEIDSYDLVPFPSHQEAFVRVSESYQPSLSSEEFREILEHYSKKTEYDLLSLLLD